MNSDFRDLMRFLNAREVRYLVVGGCAVIHHAEPRFTQYLDIRVEPTAANAAAIMQVFGFWSPVDGGGIEPDDFAKPGTQYMVGATPCAIDFLTSIPGLTFQPYWERRAVAGDDGIEVKYLSRRVARGQVSNLRWLMKARKG